jgi:predicted PurR-regulated permease PerM
MNKRGTKQFVRNWLQIIIILGAFALLVIYFNDFLGLLRKLFSVLRPVIYGSLLALILNILLVRVEGIYFPNSKKPLVLKSRRAISILISVLLVLAVLGLILGLVLPQLFNSVSIIAAGLPKTYDNFIAWVETHDSLPNAIRERILESNFDIDSLISRLTAEAQDWMGDLVALAGRIFSEFVDMTFSLIFTLYILANKEKLLTQIRRLAYAYLPPKTNISLSHILIVGYDNFVSFFGGQILSAFILGILTAIGMLILRLPFVSAVSSVVGITALIPIIGAYIGNFVGVVLILTVSPIKALIFFVFLIVLQQIEGNFIYPKIVGNRVGLPAYWVLIAIVLGGGLGGVFGIMIAVPIVATIYSLVKEDVETRTREKPSNGIERVMREARKPLYEREKISSDPDSPDAFKTVKVSIETAISEAVSVTDDVSIAEAATEAEESKDSANKSI